jgi:hypothetical protein
MRAALYARVSTVDQEPEISWRSYGAIAKPDAGRGTTLRDYGVAFATICARIREAGSGDTTWDTN